MTLFDTRNAINKCNVKCPLKQKHKAEFVYFEYHGKLENVDTVFVGECPDESEAKHKQPFYSKTYSGKILRQIIKDLNLQNYGIANIVCCRPTVILFPQNITVKAGEFSGTTRIDNIYNYKGISIRNRTPSEKECDYCIDHLKVFLKYINPKSTVILLGKTAAFSIFKNVKQVVKDNKTITALTKLPPLKFRNRVFASNFHPRYVGSAGGIGSKRYREYLKRMKKILKINKGI